MRKVNENQTEFNEGGFDNSGLLKDGTAASPFSGSTVKSWLGNEIINAFAAILKASGKSSFNGIPETEDNSEILTAINTIIDDKINIAVSNLQAKIDQCAKLNLNNVFQGTNTFNAQTLISQLSVSGDSYFEKEIKGRYQNNDTRYITKTELDSLQYVNVNDFSQQLATKITLDTNTTVEPRPTNFELGTALIAARFHSNSDDTNKHKNLNVRVYPYYYDGFNFSHKEMTVSISFNSSSPSGIFPGTWLVKGFVTAQDNGDDKDIYLITRVA